MALGIGVSGQGIDSFGDGIATLATPPNTQATGSTFWIWIITLAGVSPTSVVDNKSNTYTAVGSPILYNTAILQGQWYKSENGAGGTGHDVTVTIASPAFLTIFFQEITGATTGGEDTVVRASSNDVATPFTVTSGSLSQANEALLVGIGFNTATISSLAESSGFTITQSVLSGTSDAPGAIAVRIVAATGTYTPSFTGTGITDAGLFIVGTKQATGTTTNVVPISVQRNRRSTGRFL